MRPADEAARQVAGSGKERRRALELQALDAILARLPGLPPGSRRRVLGTARLIVGDPEVDGVLPVRARP